MFTVSKLNVYYGESHVVHDASLSVAEGEAVAVVGRNGMGKSTLLKALIGMIRARSGEIRLDRRELRLCPSHERVAAGLAYVPQGRMIFPQLTVEENIETGLETRRYQRIPDFIYEFFPVLSEMRARKGGNLSGGQQQMLAIARALASKPRLLILDEPTEGIQPSIIKEIGRSLNAFRRDLGLAVLLSEQVLSFAIDVADRVLVIDRGHIVKEGHRSDLNIDEIRSYLTV
jgi:urea transport system ATP-binding protein